MSFAKSALAGLSVGIVAMYFCDPKKGRTRRALLSDKFHALWNIKVDADKTMVKDSRNRLSGVMHRLQSRFKREIPDDVKLRERVRAKLGHSVSHPGAIEVQALGGKVLLAG